VVRNLARALLGRNAGLIEIRDAWQRSST
jgi:hypothetical protein